MLQVPTVMRLTEAPETEQTAVVAEAKLTTRPEDAVAVSPNGPVPIVRPGSGPNAIVWGAGCTTFAAIEAEDITKLVSPPYVAVIVCDPSARSVVLHVADPLDARVAALHSTWELSATKETFPVGVPTPGAATVTVAVKVTVHPTSDGLGATANALVVEAGLTVCSKNAVLPLFAPSPE